MNNKTPKELRKKIENAKASVQLVVGLLNRHGVESDWGVGIECKTTATELQRLLDENEIPKEYRVAIVGRFKAGKSAFVNELLGRKLAGEDTSPETAAVTSFRYGNEVKAKIHFIHRKDWEALKNLYKGDNKDLDAHRIATWYRFIKKDINRSVAAESHEFVDLDALEQKYVQDQGYAIEILLDTSGDGKQRKKHEAAFRNAIKQFTTGATRPPRLLRRQGQSEIRVIGG